MIEPFSTRGMVVAIRSLGEWCLAHGIVESNPGASSQVPAPTGGRFKVLTVAEVGRLLWRNTLGTLPRDPLEMRDRVRLGVAYMAGLRASEIGPLEAEGWRGTRRRRRSALWSGTARGQARTCACRWTGLSRACLESGWRPGRPGGIGGVGL